MNMKRFMNKKVVAIGLAAGITLGAAGAAFAYFTTTGTGTGAASTGSATALTITQTNPTVGGLVPGGPAATIDLSIHNGSATSQAVGPVTVAVNAVTSGTLSGTDSLGNPIGACSTTWYTTTPSVNVGVIAAGDTATTTATVSLSETNGNEDNCQAANGGGVLTLGFSA